MKKKIDKRGFLSQFDPGILFLNLWLLCFGDHQIQNKESSLLPADPSDSSRDVSHSSKAPPRHLSS
jgi:hypothetical protein